MNLLRNLTSRLQARPAPALPAAPPAAPVRPSKLAVRYASNGLAVPAKRPDGQPEIRPDFLKRLLDEQDRMPDKERLGAGYDGLVHVSSLIDACTRREVLASLHREDRFRSVTGGHRLVWAFGRAAEAHVRGQIIRGHHGKLYGKWVCRCERRHFIGMRPRADMLCQACGYPLDAFKEHPVSSHELGVVGNCDLPIVLGGNWLMVGEIKSINAAEWKELKAAKGDHVAQAATYRDLYIRNGWRVVDTVAILYAVKEFRFGSPYKEFHVDGTSQTVQSVVREVLDAAAEVKRHREAGTLPRRTCTTSTSTKAKACAVCTLCWNLE